MPGRSGSAVAAHTSLAFIEGMVGSFALSAAGARLFRRATEAGGSLFVRGTEVRTARSLAACQLGKLTDDGNLKLDGKVDGERWTFVVNPRAWLR